MIETQGFHNRTVIKKTTEYLDIDYKKTEYDYYPTMFYKRRRKTFMIHVKKDGSRFQDHYLELESIIEPMFNCELVEKRHIGRYIRYEFMPLKYKSVSLWKAQRRQRQRIMIQRFILPTKSFGIL